MTSRKELKKMREIIKRIEMGTLGFNSAYSYLDELERANLGDE
jgi:hypothetical protein